MGEKASAVLRSVASALIGAAVIAVSAALAASSAAGTAARRPTPAESRAIAGELHHLQPGSTLVSISVSTVDQRYAIARWAERGSNVTDVFRRRQNRWEMVWGYAEGQRTVGVCAFVPAAVAADFFGVQCPSERALHARPATRTERAAFARAMHAAGLPAQRLSGECVSRVDPHWAALAIGLGSTGGFVWLRHGSAWRVHYDTILRTGVLPPPSIVLSLAACTGYVSAQYGG